MKENSDTFFSQRFVRRKYGLKDSIFEDSIKILTDRGYIGNVDLFSIIYQIGLVTRHSYNRSDITL